MNKYALLFLVLLVGLSACLDEYAVPVSQQTEQLVVEALLTDEDVLASFRLSFTTQFGDASSYNPVRGAFVGVTDNLGKITKFRSSSTLPGVYVCEDVNFRGQAGKIYTLTIRLTDGRIFESSPETMPAPVAISQLSARFESKFNAGYQITADLNDPKNVENYYRWTAWGLSKRKTTGVPLNFSGICCDECWVREDALGVNLFADAGVDGNPLRGRPVFLSPFYYFGNHYVEVRQYNTSRQAFQFWRRYQEQFQRTGTIFDPIPAPVVGNVANKANANELALGFFEVASVSTKRLIVPGDTLFGKVKFEPLFVRPGDCLSAYPFSIYANVPPPGW